jgi:hypothetical protein
VSFNLRKKAQGAMGETIGLELGLNALPYGTDPIKAQYLWNNIYQNDPNMQNIVDMVNQIGGPDDINREYEQWANPETVEQAEEPAQQMENATEQLQQVLQEAKPYNIKNAKGNNKMIKPFNLKKAQFDGVPPGNPVATPGMPDGLNDIPELGEEEMQMEQESNNKKFNTHADLNNELLRLSSSAEPFVQAWNLVLSENPQEPDSAQSALKSYFEGMEMKSPEDLLSEAEIIYNLIYGSGQEIAEIPANYKEVGASFNAISEILKKTAQDNIKKTVKKSFNMKKTAQHKTLDYTVLWGPSDSKKVDPFSRQPVSDWHIVERNKGFGLVVDDVWDIDFEAIWRRNIMDKFSRPYRNKEGEWVGGYLNKRFEIDRNIPATSNYQMKPGQRRRPILPAYGNTEARLQEARSKGEIAGGPFVDKSKPFNWADSNFKAAEAKKKS